MEKEATGTKKDDFLIIKMNRPMNFEGKEYGEINLTGLNDITAADMIRVNHRLSDSGSTIVMQELTMEYALYLAAEAAGLPAEFFLRLPPREAITVKSRVTSFLYGQG